MFDSLFTSVLQPESTAASLTSDAFLACTLASLVLGVVIALVYMFKARVLQELRRDLGVTPQRRQAPSRPRRKPPRRAGSSPKGQAPWALFGTGRLARLDDVDKRGFV